MGDWINYAIKEPWLFITFAIFFFIYRAGKWTGRRLFGDDGIVPQFCNKTFGDDGVITDFIATLKEDSAALKASLIAISAEQKAGIEHLKITLGEGLKEANMAIDALERQLVVALQSRPDDAELFRILFDDHPTPAAYVDGNGRFSRVNSALQEFLGYSPSELANLTFPEVTVTGDIESDLANADKTRMGAMTRYQMDKTYVAKGGAEKPATLHVFRYPGRGVFVHFIAIIIPKMTTLE